MGLLEEIINIEKGYANKSKLRMDNFKDYYSDYQDNLLHKMSAQHLREYEGGSGSETRSYRRKGIGYPPKMASVRSSSAMTINLLGNGPVGILHGAPFGVGNYEVEYEKRLYTLGKPEGNLANLDAYLHCGTEAIFCEMKMFEWIEGQPGNLKAAYRDIDSYIDYSRDTYEVFLKAAELISSGDKDSQGADISKCRPYDAWQMFKHTLGIYNHTAITTKENLIVKIEKTREEGIELLQEKFKKITLANVVCEVPEKVFGNDKILKNYRKRLEAEHEGKEIFLEAMKKAGVEQLFYEKCGNVKFHIQYMTVPEFVNCIDLSNDKNKGNYLKRYTFTE